MKERGPSHAFSLVVVVTVSIVVVVVIAVVIGGGGLSRRLRGSFAQRRR